MPINDFARVQSEMQEVKQKGYYYMECFLGSFHRNLNLAGDVDIAKIDAECKDNVLAVRLPRTEKAKTAKI
jgi:HSP20 family molecular chaperone IbpA